MALMSSSASPVLVSVTCCGRLAVPGGRGLNSRLVGLRVTVGSTTPIPVSKSRCGLPNASSVIVTAPVRVPVAVGVKVTLIVQDEPADTPPPQVLVCAKSPLATMLVIVKARLPASTQRDCLRRAGIAHRPRVETQTARDYGNGRSIGRAYLYNKCIPEYPPAKPVWKAPGVTGKPEEVLPVA